MNLKIHRTKTFTLNIMQKLRILYVCVCNVLVNKTTNKWEKYTEESQAKIGWQADKEN